MVTATADLKDSSVAKDRKKLGDKQITFRISDELYARLDGASKGLELDTSSLLRLMIREHLPEYEDRAEAIRLKTRPRPEED